MAITNHFAKRVRARRITVEEMAAVQAAEPVPTHNGCLKRRAGNVVLITGLKGVLVTVYRLRSRRKRRVPITLKTPRTKRLDLRRQRAASEEE